MTPWSCSWTQRRQPKMAAYRLRQRVGRLEADQADLEKRWKVQEWREVSASVDADPALQEWAERVLDLLTPEEHEEALALYDLEANYGDLGGAMELLKRVERRLGPGVWPDLPGGTDGNRDSAATAGN